MSNTVLSFFVSRILSLYNPSKMLSDGLSVIDNRIPSHCIILDRIAGSNDPEVLVDQVSALFSTKETVLFLGFLFLQTDLSSEMGVVDDSVQCWSNPRIEYFKIWYVNFIGDVLNRHTEACWDLHTGAWERDGGNGREETRERTRKETKVLNTPQHTTTTTTPRSQRERDRETRGETEEREEKRGERSWETKKNSHVHQRFTESKPLVASREACWTVSTSVSLNVSHKHIYIYMRPVRQVAADISCNLLLAPRTGPDQKATKIIGPAEDCRTFG